MPLLSGEQLCLLFSHDRYQIAGDRTLQTKMEGMPDTDTPVS